jgi:hypothetical protein
MGEVYGGNQFSVDVGGRLRDLEEKLRLLKDRVLLIGKGFIDEREQTSVTLREMKKTVLTLKEENARLIQLVKNITEQLNNTARREELATVQRQLEILRN